MKKKYLLWMLAAVNLLISAMNLYVYVTGTEKVLIMLLAGIFALLVALRLLYVSKD